MNFVRWSLCGLCLLSLAVIAPAEEDQAAKEKEEGFVSIFNGKDHAGWVGNTKGYVVDAGMLVCDPKRGHGNIYTEKEYSDFVFRFEFKLTPGANNGVGIRAPLEGDAAYVGMEIQVLDDSSPIYKDVKDWQRHGSVYGIAPAKTGHLKPVGEWNSEEIAIKGRSIKVTLNGHVIVDVPDLDKIETPHPRKDHPGLNNKTGHIGFLGHGSVLAFRNLRLKDLSEEKK